MEEIVIVDGRQFKLEYGQPLTMEQKMQTIADIRKHISDIQTLQPGTYTSTANVTLLAPANIWISDISVEGATGTSDCPCAGPPSCPSITCTPNLVCTSNNCATDTENIIVKFKNSGDVAGHISNITLSIGTGTIPSTARITVPPKSEEEPGTATVSFNNVALARGTNSIAITYTWTMKEG